MPLPKPWDVYKIPTELITLRGDYKRIIEQYPDLMAKGFSYGNWDLECKPFEDTTLYNSFVERFKKQRAWSKTKYYIQIKNKTASKIKWNNIGADEILNKYEQMYETANKKVCIVNGKIEPFKLYITRDGKFAVRDGNHRLAIVKLLGIDFIYARILARHGRWLEIRCRTSYNINIEDSFLRSHPDIPINQ